MCALFESSNYTGFGFVVNNTYQEKWPNWFFHFGILQKLNRLTDLKKYFSFKIPTKKINILWGYLPFGIKIIMVFKDQLISE